MHIIVMINAAQATEINLGTFVSTSPVPTTYPLDATHACA